MTWKSNIEKFLNIYNAFPLRSGNIRTGVFDIMPIYEYECPSCCNVFEVIQRMTEDPLTSCPNCSGPVKKLVSMSSFQLKGGGWYSDGYSNNSSNGSGSAAPCKSTDKPAVKTTDKSTDKSAKNTPTKGETTKSSASDSSAIPKTKAGTSATA